jgi:signal transduction histidine kinase
MNLRPKILDDLGRLRRCSGSAAISPRSILRSPRHRAGGRREVPDRLSTVVYRRVQELLNNVASTRTHVMLVKLWLEDGC